VHYSTSRHCRSVRAVKTSVRKATPATASENERTNERTPATPAFTRPHTRRAGVRHIPRLAPDRRRNMPSEGDDDANSYCQLSVRSSNCWPSCTFTKRVFFFHLKIIVPFVLRCWRRNVAAGESATILQHCFTLNTNTRSNVRTLRQNTYTITNTILRKPDFIDNHGTQYGRQ